MFDMMIRRYDSLADSFNKGFLSVRVSEACKGFKSSVTLISLT